MYRTCRGAPCCCFWIQRVNRLSDCHKTNSFCIDCCCYTWVDKDTMLKQAPVCCPAHAMHRIPKGHEKYYQKADLLNA